MLVAVIRTILLFAFVAFAVRLMGKRQMGEMQASELVVTLMISNIAAIPMQDTGLPLLSGIVPITTLVLLELVLSLLMLKCKSLRHIVSGRPIVVVSNGEIDQAAMKKIRFTNEDLFEELRKNGIFDISKVRYAIVEPDGVISVMEDDNGNSSLYALVVSDGCLEKDSMELVGWTQEEVEQAIKQSGRTMDQIYLMIAAEDKGYRIVGKKD